MSIAKQFLAYVETAPLSLRVEATSLLARGYVKGSVPEPELDAVEAALTAMLDDPEPAVRQVLADILAPHDCTPRPIVIALAADEPSIAGPILEFSPWLTTAELVEFVGQGDRSAQTAIALRKDLRAPVAAALAEVACADVAVLLASNIEAKILSFSQERLLTRFPERADVAAALLARPDVAKDIALLAELRLLRRQASGDTLLPMREEADMRDLQEDLVLRLADECPVEDIAMFTVMARRQEVLTSALVLRAMLTGRDIFAAALFSELAGVSLDRAKNLIAEGQGGFGAMFARAGLSSGLLPIFRAALSVRPLFRPETQPLDRMTLLEIFAACIKAGVTDADAVVPMLRRLDATLARNEARSIRRRVVLDAILEKAVAEAVHPDDPATVPVIEDEDRWRRKVA